ncbi:hypothetical protein AWU65_07075 [Paenibacillus glucanolyticus]|uniref:Uncharacterized protein n=1 Tax=Paenibacillus glucanolyticus TaxID=59843 RepID=A0A163HW32_9BACL|nr:hypothetical protein [Paenibacillus glucanolyticus]KZS45690.1 hypothetical protein AWU65_07075 [Paenibacillus glucanolyticus]
MARTDWGPDDEVKPTDMNGIGQEIIDLQNAIEAGGEALKEVSDRAVPAMNRLENNYKGPEAPISDYPEGVTVFYVGAGTGGQGAAWRTATGSTEGFGFVKTIRVGTGGYQIYTEMYTGTDSTNTTNNKQYKRVKRDSNAFWQPFERILDLSDYNALSAPDYIKQPAYIEVRGTSSGYITITPPDPMLKFIDGEGIVLRILEEGSQPPGIILPVSPTVTQNFPLLNTDGSEMLMDQLKKGGTYVFRYTVGYGFRLEGNPYGGLSAKNTVQIQPSIDMTEVLALPFTHTLVRPYGKMFRIGIHYEIISNGQRQSGFQIQIRYPTYTGSGTLNVVDGNVVYPPNHYSLPTFTVVATTSGPVPENDSIRIVAFSNSQITARVYAIIEEV